MEIFVEKTLLVKDGAVNKKVWDHSCLEEKYLAALFVVVPKLAVTIFDVINRVTLYTSVYNYTQSAVRPYSKTRLYPCVCGWVE